MIQESYCSPEIAKLLMDKGFEGECHAYYRIFPDERIAAIFHCREAKKISKDNENEIICPTHQMACEWLREFPQ